MSLALELEPWRTEEEGKKEKYGEEDIESVTVSNDEEEERE